MRNSRFDTLSLVAVMALVLTAGISVAQEEGDFPPMTPEMQKEMEVWMKLAQPAEHHKHLALYEGNWKGVVKMWMVPDAPPNVDESKVEAKFIMGGRYLEWKLYGNFGGMPFEGRAIEGFNNGDGRYESMWIDNFGTVILHFGGSCSHDGKHREMTTEFGDPMTGGTIKYRTAYKWIDGDHFTYTAYMDKGDGEFRNMVIEYTRE